MIGHNPFTGKTCFFQNALYSKTDGGKVPHPADKEKSRTCGPACTAASVAASSARVPRRRPVHPHPVDRRREGRERSPGDPEDGRRPGLPARRERHAVLARQHAAARAGRCRSRSSSPEANACIKCHRMGDGRWAVAGRRLDGTDTSWNNITTDDVQRAANKYWMPPDTAFARRASGRRRTSRRRSTSSDVRRDADRGGLHLEGRPDDRRWRRRRRQACVTRSPVTDDEIAKQGDWRPRHEQERAVAAVRGVPRADQTTLHDWQEKTDTALGDVPQGDRQGRRATTRLQNDGLARTTCSRSTARSTSRRARTSRCNDDRRRRHRPLRQAREVGQQDVYDCRPFAQTSNEECDRTKFNAAGPAKF